MKYGFVLPEGDARIAANLAYEAERAGWDGFFVLDPIWGIDVWVALAAVAMRTKRIRLGPVLTPVPRIRPWRLASETATLDLLSTGRVILPVGLGDIDEFVQFGEITDRKIRAELLDEGLDIITKLWNGKPFRYKGKHFSIKSQYSQSIKPIQKPRIPIWVVGAWPSNKSMQRALRFDGILPQVLKASTGRKRVAQRIALDDLRNITAYINMHRRKSASYDIVIEGDTPGNDKKEAVRIVKQWEDAGATWWLEAPWDAETSNEILLRIKQGPPSANA